MRKIFITSNVKIFMEQADDKTRTKMKFMIAYLTDDKNILREPYVRHISIPKYKELYELRIRTAKAMARTIFTVSGDDIVLLYAFQKKYKRDNIKALECAYKMNKSSEELTRRCVYEKIIIFNWISMCQFIVQGTYSICKCRDNSETYITDFLLE